MRQKPDKLKAIGRDKPAEEFFQAFKKAVGKQTGFDFHLVEGAIDAFQAGKPENIQTLFRDIESAYFSGYSGDPGNGSRAAEILFRVIAKSADQPAAVECALAKTSPGLRQHILDHALAKNTVLPTNEAFIDLFLLLGANINATLFGKAGYTLIIASIYGSPSLVEKLYKQGADFDTALATMQDHAHKREYGAARTDRLAFYKETMTAPQQSAAPEEGTKDVQSLMMEQLISLTEQVSKMAEEIRELRTALLEKEGADAPVTKGLRLRRTPGSYPAP